MSEEGMGTKVQFKSYLPSYNLERNQNEVSRHSLSCYYEDNILSSSLYDQPLLNQANGYSLCDKEMLKRMMLEHEATFKKQVYELHRLYRLQKELMSELKNREHIWQLPQLCALSSHATGNDNKKSIPKYAKPRDAAIFQSPIETKDTSVQRGEFSDPKITGLCRKKFDLHLPAEVYIDIGNDAITEKGNNSSPRVARPSNITCNADSNNNVKLGFIRDKVDDCIDASGKLGLHPEDFPSTLELADLNETIEALGYNEEEGLASSQVIGAKSEQGEFQGHQRLSSSSKLSKNLLMSNHGNKQMFSNLVKSYQGEHCQDWSSSTNALGELISNTNGSHGGLCYKEFSVIYQLAQENPTISYEFVLPGQNKIDKSVEKKLSPDTETCKGFSKPDIDTPGPAAHKMTHPLPNISHSDNSSTMYLSISSCTKQNSMKNIPIAIQAHTNSKEYAVINSRKADATFQSPYNPSDTGQHVEDVKPKQQNFKGYLSSCENGFHQDLKEEGMPSLQTSQSVIISGESSQRKWSDNLRLWNTKVPRDEKSSSEGWLCADVMQSLEPPWLRKRQNQDDSADLEESASQLMSLRSDHDASAGNKQQDKEKDSLLVCCLEDSPCSLNVMGRSEAHCSPRSKRILGFPISESNQKGIECHASCEGLRNQINLKSSASCQDAVKTPVILPSYEVPSPFTARNLTRKVPTIIDLERLLSDTKAEKDIMVEEHKQLNCNLASVKSAITKEVNIQQTDSNHEALIREAAENLVLMSLLTGNYYYDSSSSDTLQWFADFVLSTAVGNEISREKSPCNYNGEDGLDIFEYMTLKLKEVEEEDFVCKLKEIQNYGDTHAASLLLTKPRRRQAKKRRQRRDFQKDILPGLASLSRHDVTEDLQTLLGLVKDSGKSCQAGSSRRKTNQKEHNCQARGRRRPRSLAVTVSEIHIGSSTEEQTRTKQEIGTVGILGWGRTTRRCRRQRLIPGDFSVPLV